MAAACGPGGAAQPQPGKIDPQVSLSVEVCTEGEGRDTRVYFRNLNDFEWAGRVLQRIEGRQDVHSGGGAAEYAGYNARCSRTNC